MTSGSQTTLSWQPSSSSGERQSGAEAFGGGVGVFSRYESETRIVVHGRRCQRAVLLLDDLLRLPLFEMVPPGEAEGRAAYAACVTFGKGSGHPAGLNFGDLFGYALAKVRDLPLLFKGNDFSQTDIVPAWRPEE